MKMKLMKNEKIFRDLQQKKCSQKVLVPETTDFEIRFSSVSKRYW